MEVDDFDYRFSVKIYIWKSIGYKEIFFMDYVFDIIRSIEILLVNGGSW